MSLCLRPHSVNCYAYSKPLYRCNIVDPRSEDLQAFTSAVKSFVYLSLLCKPNENVLYRETEDGGLGLLHIRYRARATLLSWFGLVWCLSLNSRHVCCRRKLPKFQNGPTEAHQPGITALQVLALEIEVDPAIELPLLWNIATSLYLIWTQRQEGTISQAKSRAELRARSKYLKLSDDENALMMTRLEFDRMLT